MLIMTDDHTKAVAIIERNETSAMSPVVAAGLEVLRENPSAETLEKLLEVQERWEANEARKAYATALVDLKRDLPSYIGRDHLVDFTSAKGVRTRYRHATLAHILDQVEPALTKHGFALSWETKDEDGGRVRVTCSLRHSQGHSESTTLLSAPDNSGGKNAIQAIGSAQSYLQRYTALAILGITTADMPDADQAPPTPDHVDVKRNREVAAKIVQTGRPVKDAEAHVGRHVAEWTTEDIETLRKWVRKSKYDGVGPEPMTAEEAGQ